MIRALLIQILCLWLDLHDTGTKRTGSCTRCHLWVGENGSTHR